jgi:hypothetical protein
MKGAFFVVGFVDRVHLRAQQVGAQEIVRYPQAAGRIPL